MTLEQTYIDKSKTVCVTGHRTIYNQIDLERLKRAFVRLIDSGFDTFLVGMAIGFDTICFKVLEEIRKSRRNIRIIACIPCLGQDKFFNDEQKKQYRRMIKSADENVVISEHYTSDCMMKRNKFMVDNSSVVVAYLKKFYGGTFFTFSYAKEKNLKYMLVE